MSSGGPVFRLSAKPFVSAFLAAILVAPLARAQSGDAEHQHATQALSKEQISTLARVFVAISNAQDSTNKLRSAARNKTKAMQAQIQADFLAERAGILQRAGITDETYAHQTYILATDNDVRHTFDSVVAVITGVPTPGQVAASGKTNIPVPAGPVGAHIGHVINGFSDTPDGMGLLPAAMAEAKIAAQHATLAARDLNNLVSMQTHAGHVIHALDPTIVTMGPGRGYGMKKAALAAATHIELAAKAQGASANVNTHATHIAAAARAAATRADQVIALAQQIQAAKTAAEAAKLVSEMVPLADQLEKGVDANADGRISWDKPEGGLQQAEEHVKLLLAAEMK